MIDVKLLTFITVAKTKNFTRAANILNITQPAVSQHIKALEEYYNVKLFHKKNNGMQLTYEGKILFKYSVELHRLSKVVENELKNRTSEISRYYVGATLTVGGYVIPNIIGKYRSMNESIDIILYVENTEAIMKRLFNGDISLGIVEGPFNKAKVKYTKFKEDELVLAVSPNHPLASKGRVTLDELLREKLILREKGSGTRKVFEDKLLEVGYSLEDVDVYMEIGNITALISLVESNLGCTIISKEAIKQALKENTLKIIPIDNFRILREFNFVYLNDTEQDFVDEFIRFCISSTYANIKYYNF